MRFAEVWGTALVEVELDERHWLEGDDTYHQLAQRRVMRSHANLICMINDTTRLSRKRDGVEYEFFPADHPTNANDSGSRSAALLSYIKEWAPDVVLLHSANRMQTLLCLQQRAPSAAYILASNSAATHGIVFDEIASNPSLVDACLFKTPSIRDHFCASSGYPKDQTCVLPSGIDTQRFHPHLVRKDIDCIWVGYLRANNYRKKNVALLIDVLKELSGKLVIVGQGKMVSTLRDIAPPNVTFHGFADHQLLPELLSRSKLFLLPSLYDPAPRAASEALACGLPIIGLKTCTGTEEQIIDGVTGYRVETPMEMRQAIQQLLQDEATRISMSRAARTLAEQRFNIERIDHELEAFITKSVES